MAIKKPLYWLIALTFLVTTLSIGQALAYARTESYLLNPPFAGSTSKWTPRAAIYDSGVFQDTDGSIETTAPTVISFDPADDTTGVATDTNLVITFNENVVKGTGNIVIYKSIDDGVFLTIDVIADTVTIVDNVATIKPYDTFTSGTSYYVQIAATCFKDTSGNHYAGISDKTTWNFTCGMPTEVVILSGEWVIVDRILLASLLIADLSGNVILGLDSGTEIICSDNKIPEKLSIGISEEMPPVPDNLAVVSPVYNLVAYTSGGVPQPVAFDPPIRLQINYDPEELPENTSTVFIAYYDEEQGWTQLEPPSEFVAEVGTAAAQVSHFTSFAAMVQLAAPVLPARFEVRNLDINPIEVMPGESVTVSAWLSNIGGLSGEHITKVNMEGLLETSQMTRLSPGQSQKITFTVTPSSPGSYEVKIDDLRGNFVVRAIPVPKPTPTAPVPEAGGYGWLIAIISAMAAIAVLTFIIVRERLQPALAVEAGVYGWLIPTSSAVAAIAALAFTSARERLQRAPVVKKPSKPVPSIFRFSDVAEVATSAFTTARERSQRAIVVKKPSKPVPGPLRVSNLKIVPNRVKLGRKVTITAKATNVSPIMGSYSLVLKIKGLVEAIKEITLEPGQSQKVTFTILKDKPGNYDLDLENLKGSFTVEDVAAPLDSSS